jgi:hypothetical protein
MCHRESNHRQNSLHQGHASAATHAKATATQPRISILRDCSTPMRTPIVSFGFDTYALSRTGNLAAVMKTMGHRDVKTAMQYQHPEPESVRVVINDRNSRHKSEFLQ